MKKKLSFLLGLLGTVSVISLPLIAMENEEVRVDSFSQFHPQNNQSVNKDDVNYSNIKKILDDHFTKNQYLLNSSKDKDIVVFLGETGAGKSTLINYLSGKELEVDEFNEIKLKNPNDPSAMEIGGTGKPVTLLPQFIQSGDFLFYDLPGFGDTRRTAINLMSASFIKNIITNAKTTRFVFVAGLDEITAGRGKIFEKLLSITKKLIPEEKNIELFSSLIITKSGSEIKSIEDLNKYLYLKVDKELLEPWVTSGLIARMSKPRDGKISPQDRIDIRGDGIDIKGKLSNVKPLEIKEINIGAIYSGEVQGQIKDIFKDAIDKIVNTQIGLIPTNFSDIQEIEKQISYYQNDFQKKITEDIEKDGVITLLRDMAQELYEGVVKEKQEYVVDKQKRAIADLISMKENRALYEENHRLLKEQRVQSLQRGIEKDSITWTKYKEENTKSHSRRYYHCDLGYRIFEYELGFLYSKHGHYKNIPAEKLLSAEYYTLRWEKVTPYSDDGCSIF